VGASATDRPWLADAHADVYALADESEQQRAIALIGAPGELVKAAELDAIPLWSRWADQITSIIRGSGDSGSALSHLAEWQRAAAEDQDIASSIYRNGLVADMGGQLFVRTVEAPETLPTRSLDDRIGGGFMRLEFTEAIQAFLARGIISPDEFAALSDAHRAKAFTVTRLATEALIKRVNDLIASALRDGSTFDEFAAALTPDTLGITAASPAYLETVYRTSVGMAYGAGRLRQIQSPAVQAARPYVQYRTAGDNRVRASHAALDRVVFKQDDPQWTRLMPPNGFNCRCTCVTMRESQVDKSRVRSSVELPADAQPDPGFDAAPTGE
jgi:SPP1 gp7 family putative phage head morphogenesis protein